VAILFSKSKVYSSIVGYRAKLELVMKMMD
jgi:hypothetical protein